MNLYKTQSDNGEITWINKLDELMSLERPIFNINVGLLGENASVELLMAFLEHRGSEVRSLIVWNGQFSTYRQLTTIVQRCPKLESFVSQDCYIQGDNQEVIEPVMMENMRNLSLYHSCYNVLNVFKNAPITSFKLQRPTSFQPGSIIDLLNSWKSLESFEINRICFTRHFEDDLSQQAPQKLKKFSFYISNWYSNDSQKVDINLSAFLRLNRDTLEELTMEKIRTLECKDNFMRTIFNDLRQLKKWKFDSELLKFYAKNQESLQQLPSMMKLKEIFIDRTKKQTCNYEKTFICKFPELEQIRSDGYVVPSKWVKFLSRVNPKLKEIPIKSIGNEEAANSRFDFLKILRIGNTTNADLLMKFVENNPSIETLSVTLNAGNEISGDNFAFLMNQKNLKQLTFSGKIEAVEVFHDQVKNVHEKAQLVEENGISAIFCFPKDSSCRDQHWNL